MIKITLKSGLTIEALDMFDSDEYYKLYGCTLTHNGLKLNEELLNIVVPLIEIAKFVKIPS